jgi:transposase
MRSLLTEREVAELLECAPRSVRRKQLATEPAGEKARNGKSARVYHVSSLPAEVQRAWGERQRQKVVEMVPALPGDGQLTLSLTAPAGPNLSAEERAEAEKRYAVIEPLVKPEKYAALWAQAKGSKCALVEILARQHGRPARTIYHWLKAFRESGLPALVNRARNDKGKPRVMNSAALDFLVAAALPRQGCYGELSVREIHRAYGEEQRWRLTHADGALGEFERRKYARYVDESGGKLAPAAQLPAVSYETLRAWFERIPEVVRVMAREGEEAFSNTQEIISFRDLREIKPLDWVVMDHRRLDIFCLVKGGTGKNACHHWKLARPWLTAALDMRTRKWLAWVIVEQPSSDSIAAVLKRTFLDHGLPAACYWDNGRDFCCEWLEGRRARNGESYKVRELGTGMRGVLETLGVRVHHAIVKRARSKIIEPNFLNVAHFDRALPWFCGHKPEARPERFDALVEKHERWVKGEAAETPFKTIESIAWLYDEFLTSLNEREHSGEGMQKITPSGRGWMTPDECWSSLIGGVERRSAPAEALQFCFQKRRRMTVRNGELQPSFGGRQFHYRLSGNPVALAGLNGREVEFAYDPHDLGTAAVYHEDRFVGLVDNVELRRMGEESFVADERERRAMRREVKEFIRAVHRAVYIPTAEDRAQRRMAVRPAQAGDGGWGMGGGERREVAAAIPEEVMAAAAAAAGERAFSFANAAEGVDLVRAHQDHDPDDGDFQFFQEG